MSNRNIRILGTGAVLPSHKVTNQILEERLGLEVGEVEARTGMVMRYHVVDEEAVELGVKAAHIALQRAGLEAQDIDLVIGVSGVMQQAIPSMSALLHKKLNLQKTQTFDVNATCLSFLTGLSVAAEFIASGRYQRVLLVSADIASVGLDPKDLKTSTLFGDGAAAAVLGVSQNTSSHIKAMHFETWTEEQESCFLETGGSKWHGKTLPPDEQYKQYFQMDGPRLFRATIPHVMHVLEALLEESELAFSDLKLFIPHQASPLALKLFSRRLNKHYRGQQPQFLNIVGNVGNMIATSLPYSLNYAIEHGLIQRGDKVCMFGTSAGLSIGGVIFEY